MTVYELIQELVTTQQTILISDITEVLMVTNLPLSYTSKGGVK